ncbi:hypothetical protein [Streptomyces sp. NPDC126514]|uniref:hypothetical protein n=1 Tax=Streptomyces sp. NPDC126514 TaxID=3155210 RepID=UPI00332559F9
MTQAATTAGIDPDRLSLTTALHTIRLPLITANTTGPTLLADVLRKARNLAPAQRRSCTSPRCVKRTLSPYAYNKTKGGVGHKTTVTITITLSGTDRP